MEVSRDAAGRSQEDLPVCARSVPFLGLAGQRPTRLTGIRRRMRGRHRLRLRIAVRKHVGSDDQATTVVWSSFTYQVLRFLFLSFECLLHSNGERMGWKLL